MPTQPATENSSESIPKVQRFVAIFWPSFMTAIGATIVFFSIFSPGDLAALAGKPEISATGGYTVGFFFFWAIAAIACRLAMYFCKPCASRQSN